MYRVHVCIVFEDDGDEGLKRRHTTLCFALYTAGIDLNPIHIYILILVLRCRPYLS